MTSPTFQSLQVPQSVAAGAWLSCQGLGNKHAHVFGTFSATLQVQYTVGDDTEPSNVGTPLTAAGNVAVPMVVKKLPFEEARTVFFDDNALMRPDEEHSDDEDRFLLLGLSG
jgi:hypothetical protein